MNDIPSVARILHPFDGVEVLTLAVDDAFEMTRGATILSEQEKCRLARIRHGATRRRYAAAHCLLRQALTRYAEGALRPEEWRFVFGAHGKPAVAPGLPEIRFNLSFADDCIAMSLTRSREIGIDIEPMPGDIDEPMPFGISPREEALLRRLPVDARARQIARVWTFKEAIAKAIGCGIDDRFTQIDACPVLLTARSDYWATVDGETFDVRLADVQFRGKTYFMAVAVGPVAASG
ncbi:holo-(acyl carrier protein) synthase 2 [Hartmannibacter diazotrophicus]|uniref:Holo-(Acyl carrier protein) synthase 2 n=1 Tax=Hartmannibacter diazotrophicus TaxID=1482074 RepID=A0A2C9D9B2_9HYPH|nr:4'-phosphopantetheinyl transferase superfamily protein [Hartmannibacter diazotrophicus]SON56779.1 holo-(acyl carrier protein) synthase 2 [Hartmannibacter diazotrophicus]